MSASKPLNTLRAAGAPGDGSAGSPRGRRRTFPRTHGHRRNVLAVASGKGGVGKTWFAITLAHALADQGQRALLLDGDLGLANVDIQLGLAAPADLAAVIDGGAQLETVIGHVEAGGFDVVAGRSGAANLAAASRGRLDGLLGEIDAVADTYDRVILDLGAGVEQTVRAFCDKAGTCLVVTTDEPTALTDAYAFIKMLSRRNATPDIRIVVNMAHNRHEGERTYTTLRRACEGFLKFSPPLAGVVRRDPLVKDAIRAQSPVLARYPACPAALDVRKIAAALDGDPAPVPA